MSSIDRTHAFDGGRSRAIRQSLDPLLNDVRHALTADVAVALHRSLRGHTGVLAVAGARDLVPLTNEEVRLTDAAGRPLSITRACLLRDVVLTSLARPWKLELSSAIAVPWAEGAGQGVVLAGVVPGRWMRATLESIDRYVPVFEFAHRDASYRGTMRLADDLAAACRAVDRAELETSEAGELLASVAAIARNLLGTATAYIATAEPDRPLHASARRAFPFTTLVGIRTPEFRRLRMSHDQGLGGLARRERTTVCTTDYSEDARLQGAPVRETREEGIVSAICTPLIFDGIIQGTLYLGDRRQRVFGDTDAEILDEFASHASLRVGRQHVEEHRINVLRHRERERLASILHDSVVRSLVEIGYHAQKGRLQTEDADLRGLLANIGESAGATLESLREELAALGGGLSSHVDAQPVVGDLIETLRMLPSHTSIVRTFTLRGLDHTTEMSPRVLDVLIAIGEEAITNAERHSDCTKEDIVLAHVGGELRLSVADDGRGIDVDLAGSAMSTASGHLGLRGMRSAIRTIDGHLRITDADGGGTQVTAVVPWDGGPGTIT